jgi:adenine/guanine phosphoribosyltransferase-like PRPP-binding protein
VSCPSFTPAPEPEGCFVDAQRFFELLESMTAVAAELSPPVDSLIGVKRSGLFPAVYLSERLDLPLFLSTELASFPCPKFTQPLIVDTTCWSGATLRRLTRRLEQRGASLVRSLVMFARQEPYPDVANLQQLELAASVPRFWYTQPLRQAQ